MTDTCSDTSLYPSDMEDKIALFGGKYPAFDAVIV